MALEHYLAKAEAKNKRLPEIPEKDLIAIKNLYYGNENSRECSRRSSNAFLRKVKRIKEDLKLDQENSEKLCKIIQTLRPRMSF